MVENRPFHTFLTHAILILGVALVLFPVWIAFVASTHSSFRLNSGIAPFWPGGEFWTNYGLILSDGASRNGLPPVLPMMLNSLVMALGVSPGLAAWMSPVIAGLLFSIPIVMLTSSRAAGQWLQRRRIFATPEELSPPTVLVRASELRAEPHPSDASRRRRVRG